MFKFNSFLTIILMVLIIAPFSLFAQSTRTIIRNLPTESVSNDPVAVALPSINAASGTTVSMPITVGELTGRGAISYDFEVRFDPNVLRPAASAPTTKNGTLSSNFTITANPYLSGRLLVSGFSAYPLSGQGTLLYLNFDVIGQSGANAGLTWQSFFFNEGDPSVKLSVGGVTVGTTPVAVSMPSVSGNPSSVVTIPVKVGDLTNRSAISFDFEIRFDPAVLRPVISTPTSNAGTLSSGFVITANPYLSGRLLVSGFNAYPLTGQGTLLNLNFEIIGQAGARSPLTFQSFIFNEGNPAAAVTNGQFSINSIAPVVRRGFDFDGDGKADLAVFGPADRFWYRMRSATGFAATQFGLATDKLVPADYDGDGKTDLAVYRDGVWYWLNSSNGAVNTVSFGAAGDIPVPADYTGDGRAELAVYRSGSWYSFNTVTNQNSIVQFGAATDKPVAGDYDGDGKSDQAFYRDGQWHLNRSTAGYTVVNFGIATDKPVVGDFDGDGKADQAVFRSGMWYINRSAQGFLSLQFGILTDIPVAADYDGDGKTDIAVFRNGVWYQFRSQSGFASIQFGTGTDKPIPAALLN